MGTTFRTMEEDTQVITAMRITRTTTDIVETPETADGPEFGRSYLPSTYLA